MELLVIPGDGIGPEVIAEACRVADRVARHRNLPLTLRRAAFGLETWATSGHLMPPETFEAVLGASAILFGAIGGPEYDAIPLPVVRGEGLLRIRKELDLFANLRPVKAWPALSGVCPLVPSRAAGTDMLIVRELAGGLYYGDPRGIAVSDDGDRIATNTLSYKGAGIRRIAEVAFRAAGERSRRVTSVDKSNVLENGQLWREEVEAVASGFPGIALAHMLVDNCALQLMRNPAQFDVIVTENLFGDILSDAAGAISGSLGMLPSASLCVDGNGKTMRALYEPVHGSAPDIAGRNIANPIAAILSLAMAFRFSFDDAATAAMIEQAVDMALAGGVRTMDIMEDGMIQVGTAGMGDAILNALDNLAHRERVA